MEQTIKFEFTVNETNIVLHALSNLPFRDSASLIEKMKTTAQSQISPAPLPALGEESEGGSND